MGLREFLQKRRDAKELRALEEERIRDEAAAVVLASRQEKLEARVRKREGRELKRQERHQQEILHRRERQGILKRKRALRQKVAYERIHFWVESRIGILDDLEDEEIVSRLQGLLTEERQRNSAPERAGNMRSDPYGGLEAYIRTNSYRKMLSGDGVLEDVISAKGAGAGAGGVGAGAFPDDQRPPLGTHPEYERLQCWIDERIGSLNGLNSEEVHTRMLELLESERKSNSPEQRQTGGPYDAQKGLEAYIRSRSYLKVLRKEPR
jgi:hypothetical protein